MTAFFVFIITCSLTLEDAKGIAFHPGCFLFSDIFGIAAFIFAAKQTIIAATEGRALQLIEKHRKLIAAIRNALLDREFLDHDEFLAIVRTSEYPVTSDPKREIR